MPVTWLHLKITTQKFSIVSPLQDSTITKFFAICYFFWNKSIYFFKYSAFENFKIFFLIEASKYRCDSHIFIKTNIEIQPKILITTYLKHDYLRIRNKITNLQFTSYKYINSDFSSRFILVLH
jgi:hypothetical protein